MSMHIHFTIGLNLDFYTDHNFYTEMKRWRNSDDSVS